MRPATRRRMTRPRERPTAWPPRRRPAVRRVSSCRPPRTPRGGRAANSRASTSTRPVRSSAAPDCSASIARAGTPAHRPPRSWCGRRSVSGRPSAMPTVQATVIDVGDHRPEVHVDAQLPRSRSVRRTAAARTRRAPRARRRRAAPGPSGGRCDGSSRAAIAGTARRSGRPSRPRSGRRPPPRRSATHPALGVGLDLGHLERTEDPPAQLERVVDRLHARRPPAKLVVAEVGGLRHRRPRSGCRRRRCGRLALVGGDLAGGKIDRGDLAEHHGGVALPAQMSRIGGAISPEERIPVASW